MQNEILNNLLKTICEKHHLPGISVCINRTDGIRWKGFYGFRSVDSCDCLQINDLFRAGSTTKTLVSAIILQLRDEGLLSLDQSVVTVLQDVLDIDSAISIRHLLNHRSGLEDYLWVEEDGQPMLSKFDGPIEYYAPESLIKKALQANIRFEPNKGYYYSNTNYILLGLIIEKVTEQSLVDVLNKRIIEPLNMEQTYFPTTSSISKTHANGHSKLTKDFQLSEHIVSEYNELNVSIAWAAGALISSPDDLNKFMIGLLNHQIVSKISLEEMMKFIETGAEGKLYGLGLYEFNDNQNVAIGHPGGIPGYETIMLYYPKDNCYLTVMINQMPASIIKIAEEIYSNLNKVESQSSSGR